MILDFINKCGFDESSVLVQIGFRRLNSVVLNSKSKMYFIEIVEETIEIPGSPENILVKKSKANIDNFCSNQKIEKINFIWAEIDNYLDISIFEDNKILDKTEFVFIENINSQEKMSSDGMLNAVGKEWFIRSEGAGNILLENVNYRATLIDGTGFWKDKNINEHVFDSKLSCSILNYLKHKKIKTCVDFGCGLGHYVEYFNSSGITTEGYDGNPFTPELTKGKCNILNLAVDFDLGKKFDCVLSLEVGEHIPKEYEEVFINNLIKHTNDLIILSWAIPNQGGHGHVNCQTNEYIKKIFKTKGFKSEFYMENIIRLSATEDWFNNTIMIFKKI